MASKPSKSTRNPRRLPATRAADVTADLAARVGHTISERRLLRGGQRVMVAVSGGVDSMVLLHLLRLLSRTRRWRIVAAHFNHQLRGRASAADEQLVKATARALHLPMVCGRADVPRHARRQHLSVEMAARELRHRFLAGQARRLRIPTVALAHHADDQVELFFLRLLRGSGGQGLGGMPWCGPSPAGGRTRLIRPLLDLPKSVLRAYAIQHHIEFREDASNANLDIQRNRLRQSLLPRLRKEYQPALEKTVLRVMEILSAEADCVTATAQAWLRAPGAVAFDVLPLAVQRRSLQLQLQKLGLVSDFDLIEQLRRTPGKPVMTGANAVSFARGTPGTTATIVRDTTGSLHHFHRRSLAFRKRALRFPLEGTSGRIDFGGLHLTWRKRRHASGTPPVRIPGRETFDADKIGKTITLRHWRAGDRFQPIGMANCVKLQDFLTNAKVPAGQRRQLVMGLSESGEIFWVEGMRISERFKLVKGTKRCLNWAWRR